MSDVIEPLSLPLSHTQNTFTTLLIHCLWHPPSTNMEWLEGITNHCLQNDSPASSTTTQITLKNPASSALIG